MKNIKLASSTLLLPFKVDGDTYFIHCKNVAPQSNQPQQLALVASKQRGGEDFEGGILDQKVVLSEYYRTQEEFDGAVKNGFQVSDSFVEDRMEAKRILEALCKQGLATVINQKK